MGMLERLQGPGTIWSEPVPMFLLGVGVGVFGTFLVAVIWG